MANKIVAKDTGAIPDWRRREGCGVAYMTDLYGYVDYERAGRPEWI